MNPANRSEPRQPGGVKNVLSFLPAMTGRGAAKPPHHSNPPGARVPKPPLVADLAPSVVLDNALDPDPATPALFLRKPVAGGPTASHSSCSSGSLPAQQHAPGTIEPNSLLTPAGPPCDARRPNGRHGADDVVLVEDSLLLGSAGFPLSVDDPPTPAPAPAAPRAPEGGGGKPPAAGSAESDSLSTRAFTRHQGGGGGSGGGGFCWDPQQAAARAAEPVDLIEFDPNSHGNFVFSPAEATRRPGSVTPAQRSPSASSASPLDQDCPTVSPATSSEGSPGGRQTQAVSPRYPKCSVVPVPLIIPVDDDDDNDNDGVNGKPNGITSGLPAAGELADAADEWGDGEDVPWAAPARPARFVPLFDRAPPLIDEAGAGHPGAGAATAVDEHGNALPRHNYHPLAKPRSGILRGPPPAAAPAASAARRVSFTLPLTPSLEVLPAYRVAPSQAPSQTQGSTQASTMPFTEARRDADTPGPSQAKRPAWADIDAGNPAGSETPALDLSSPHGAECSQYKASQPITGFTANVSGGGVAEREPRAPPAPPAQPARKTVRFEEPKARFEEPKGRFEEPKGRLEEPKVRFEEPKGRFEEPKVRFEEPKRPEAPPVTAQGAAAVRGPASRPAAGAPSFLFKSSPAKSTSPKRPTFSLHNSLSLVQPPQGVPAGPAATQLAHDHQGSPVFDEEEEIWEIAPAEQHKPGRKRTEPCESPPNGKKQVARSPAPVAPKQTTLDKYFETSPGRVLPDRRSCNASNGSTESGEPCLLQVAYQLHLVLEACRQDAAAAAAAAAEEPAADPQSQPPDSNACLLEVFEYRRRHRQLRPTGSHAPPLAAALLAGAPAAGPGPAHAVVGQPAAEEPSQESSDVLSAPKDVAEAAASEASDGAAPPHDNDVTAAHAAEAELVSQSSAELISQFPCDNSEGGDDPAGSPRESTPSEQFGEDEKEHEDRPDVQNPSSEVEEAPAPAAGGKLLGSKRKKRSSADDESNEPRPKKDVNVKLLRTLAAMQRRRASKKRKAVSHATDQQQGQDHDPANDADGVRDDEADDAGGAPPAKKAKVSAPGAARAARSAAGVFVSMPQIDRKGFTPLFGSPVRGERNREELVEVSMSPVVTPPKGPGAKPGGSGGGAMTPPTTPPPRAAACGDASPKSGSKRVADSESPSKKRLQAEKRIMESLSPEAVKFAEATKECALCKVNTDDTARLTTLGELMEGRSRAEHPELIRKGVGRRSRPIPLRKFHQVLYFHWHCLRYAQLSVDDPELLGQHLLNSLSTECAGCTEAGATIPCSEPLCSRFYHLPCALLLPDVVLNNRKGTLTCPEHRKTKKSK
ncbi:hypothetical protein DIPPA_18520 [Diplonema papillatum]|nr:hypothetical protein DIPPA_18520 [Diplonema papillatum]